MRVDEKTKHIVYAHKTMTKDAHYKVTASFIYLEHKREVNGES